MAHVLYVEDDPASARIVTRLLAGHQVEVVPDGQKALTWLERSPPPDLVLVDLHLPGVTGFELVSRIPPAVPVVAHTAARLDQDGIPVRDQALALGCAGYISKPVGGNFRSVVEAYLAGRRDPLPPPDQVVRALRAYSRQVVDRLWQLVREREFFAAAAVHELRTPLTVLTTSVTLLGHGLALTPDLQAQLVSAVRQLQARVGDLLLFTGLEEGREIVQARPVALGPALHDFAGRHARVCDACRLEVHCPADLTVLADPDRLEQILDNLVDNAHKFAAPDRPLHIRVQAERPTRPPPQAVIGVSDNGIGMEASERVFQPFTRLPEAEHQAVPGLGLGLALVRKLTQLMGGQTWCQGQPGRGTAIYLTLPLAEDAGKKGER